MTFEDFVTITVFGFAIVCHIGYRCSLKYVYLKYREQKVGGCSNKLRK